MCDTARTTYNDLINRDGYWKTNPGQNSGVQKRTKAALEAVNAKRVLDIGCGRGHLSLYLVGNGYDVCACDIADASQYLVGTPVHFTQEPVQRLLYQDDAFDVALCVDVLEHLDPRDIPEAFRQVFRVAPYMYGVLPFYPSHHGPYQKLHPTLEPPKVWLGWIKEYAHVVRSEIQLRRGRSDRQVLEVLARRKEEE